MLETVMPRCWPGGSEVVVASRPPSATAWMASSAPPGAALAAATGPWLAVIAWTCPGKSELW
jgi:hypothetical protein